MANMAYCRFHNTWHDLRDCEDHWDDEDLSSHEIESRDKLLKVCKRIVEYYGQEE